MTLTEIRVALESRGLRPLKQLGQNFLHDQNLAKWLAEHAVAGLEAGANVVEIGPGLGALTSVLLQKNLHLIALEKDRGLCVFLREHFGPEITRGSLDLREGDALEMLPRLGVAPAVICGNLPYYISTPLRKPNWPRNLRRKRPWPHRDARLRGLQQHRLDRLAPQLSRRADWFGG